MGRSYAVPRKVSDERFGPDADDSRCFVLHVDMDAFYASVEIRRRPELRGRPVIVGGPGGRSVVCSASYEARRYGVRSAMPCAVAKRHCPGAVFLPPDFAAYHAASQAIMAIFRDFTPLVEPISLDEAFLDVSRAVRLFGRPAQIAAKIRERIATEQGLPCSVGVAPTKFVAKLASARAKPNGLLVVPADLVLEFLHPLPVSALWGVGERTAEVLQRSGLRTVGDVACAPIGLLRGALGAAVSAHLQELAAGRDPRQVNPQHAEKSIGSETTFDVDVADPKIIRGTLLELAGRVAARMRRANLVGRRVTVKVRLSNFRTLNRSRTLPTPTDVAREVFEVAWSLFSGLRVPGRIRLIGVRLDGLCGVHDAPRQLELGAAEYGWREAELAVDRAVARFGQAAVRPASLLQQKTGELHRKTGERDPARQKPDENRPVGLACRDGVR